MWGETDVVNWVGGWVGGGREKPRKGVGPIAVLNRSCPASAGTHPSMFFTHTIIIVIASQMAPTRLASQLAVKRPATGDDVMALEEPRCGVG